MWQGVSVESERYLDRIEDLRHIGAAVKFLSLEPLLGAMPSLDLRGIDWVIVGGESGPGARPIDTRVIGQLIARSLALFADADHQQCPSGACNYQKTWTGGASDKSEGGIGRHLVSSFSLERAARLLNAAPLFEEERNSPCK